MAVPSDDGSDRAGFVSSQTGSASDRLAQVERCCRAHLQQLSRHHPAVGLRQPRSSGWPGRSLDPECKVLLGCRRPGAVGGAGPSVLYTHRQASRRLFGQVWSLRGLWSSALPAPPISDFSPPSRNSIKTGCLYFLSLQSLPTHPLDGPGQRTQHPSVVTSWAVPGPLPGTISLTPRTAFPDGCPQPKPVPSQVPCSRPCLLSQCPP